MPAKKPESLDNQKGNSINYLERAQNAANLARAGKNTEAKAIYEDLLCSGIRDSRIHLNLGCLYASEHQYRKAIDQFRKSTTLNESSVDARTNLGLALKQQGDIKGAIAEFRKALKLDKSHVALLINLGTALRAQGKLRSAVICQQRALDISPNCFEAALDLANTFLKKGEYQRAIDLYESCLRSRPESLDALLGIAKACQEHHDFSDSLFWYQKALDNSPGSTEGLNGLGISLVKLGRDHEAINTFKQAILKDSSNEYAYINLGNALHQTFRHEEAIEQYKIALSLNSSNIETIHCLASAFHSLGRISEEKNAYIAAIGINRDIAESHYRLSLIYLLQGDYALGWREYEWRLYTEHVRLHEQLLDEMLARESSKDQVCGATSEARSVRWSGEFPDKRPDVVIISEQGIGDVINFIRYAIVLRNQGFRIIVIASEKICPLLKESLADIEVSSRLEESDKGKPWIPLMSIPQYLSVSPANPILTSSYITVNEQSLKRWRHRLRTSNELIIGVNWKGNRPDKGKKERNFSLTTLLDYTSGLNINYVSLQRKSEKDDWRPSGQTPGFVGCQDVVHQLADSDSGEDFLTYAAIVASCDLVISSNTTVCHLSAAMGVKTWVLLPKIPDWRWGLVGENTFWYPSMRLFRQKHENDWNSVLKDIAQSILEMLALSQSQAINKNETR